MNKDNFPTMDSKQRVKTVNDLLKKEGFDLQKVADHLAMKYSTFTKLMQEDDYVYIKRDNQYYKFVRNGYHSTDIQPTNDDELAYLKANFTVLQSLIERHKVNNDFILDKRIFHSTSKVATKNFRISDDLYKQFVKTCDEHFPHLKIQDIIAQLLLSFVDQYPSQTK